MAVSRAKAERALRDYRRGPGAKVAAIWHATRREQDEMVCKCGKRWPVGEDHP